MFLICEFLCSNKSVNHSGDTIMLGKFKKTATSLFTQVSIAVRLVTTHSSLTLHVSKIRATVLPLISGAQAAYFMSPFRL